MTDDVARDPAEFPADTGQSEDRPKRSRRRGKRSKSKPTEGQNAPVQAVAEASQKAAAEPARPVPTRGGRKSGSQKGGYYPFNDGLDRFVCPDCVRFLPLAYPVQHRRGTATVALREVARREREILLCNGLHAGPCLWPDGVVVTATPITPNDTPSEPGESDTTVRTPDDDGEPDDISGIPSDAPVERADVSAMQLAESP